MNSERASSVVNPMAGFLHQQGSLILDGGLATQLESRGHVLDDALWSAKILLDSPDAIRSVHKDFLMAGADCITTSTYQASVTGFGKHGLSEVEADDVLRKAVGLAIEARDEFWSDHGNHPGRLRPLVAASVGPYGAFLSDGSEYTGRYGIDDDALYAFHRRRWHLLAESEVDLLACETIPSHREAEVLRRLMRESPGCWAWMSFSCRDGSHLCDGSRLIDVVRACDTEPRLAAIGINCTSPEFISALITEVRRGTGKPIIVYPNSGERYSAATKNWLAAPSPVDWEEVALEWTALGAVGIGGCCRVGPHEIARIRHQLLP